MDKQTQKHFSGGAGNKEYFKNTNFNSLKGLPPEKFIKILHDKLNFY